MSVSLEYLLGAASNMLYRTMANANDDDDDDWVFDTIKPGGNTIVSRPQSQLFMDQSIDDAFDFSDQEENTGVIPMDIQTDGFDSIQISSTVKRAPSSNKRARRHSSGTFNEKAFDTVRLLRNNKSRPEIPSNPEPSHTPKHHQEDHAYANIPRTASPAQQNSRESAIGQMIYSQAIGFACQEEMRNSMSQAKREAIARLAEAWSGLEMIDPSSIYRITKGTVGRLER